MSDDRRISAEFDVKSGPNTRRTIQDLEDLQGITRDLDATSLNNAASAGGSITASTKQLGGSSAKAARSVQQLATATRVLGIETGGTVNAVMGLAPLLPLATTGISGMAAATGALTLAMAPIIAAFAAVVAVGAIATIALDGQTKANEELAQQVRRSIELERLLAEARGMTTDSIEEQLAVIKEELALEKELLADTKDKQKQLQDAADSMGLLYDFSAALTNSDAPLNAANKAVKEQTGVVNDLTDKHTALTDALGSEAVAANDARAALLESVDAEADLARFRNQALENTAEQNAEIARGIEQEKAIKQGQINQLKDSGDTDKEVTDRIAELNGEMDELNKQSEVLSSNAVKASEAQKEQADAAGDLAQASQDAAKAQSDAAAKTSAAQKQQRKGVEEFLLSAIETTDEVGKLQAEQSKKLIDLANDANLEEDRIQRDLAKKRKNFAKNQQFLALFDAQDEENENKQERDRARSAKFQALREELAVERAEKQMAFEQGQADKMAQLQQDAILTGEAVAAEQKILKQASNDNLKILNSRAKQETEVYGQMNKNIIQMLSNVGQFSAQVAGQVSSALGQVSGIGGAGGGAGGGASGGGQLGSLIDQHIVTILDGVMK